MTARLSSAVVVLIIFLSLIVPGCMKKEAPKKEKTSAAEEKKEGPHEEEGVVFLSEEKVKSSGIETAKIAHESISAPISATAVIELNTDRTAKIGPRVQGRISSINVSQGDRVKAGQTLALMDSPDLDQTWADYQKALGKAELARRNLQREETLFEKKVSPEKDVLKARQELGEAEADVSLARDKFRLFDVNIAQLEAKKDGRHPLVPITSPIRGIVIEKTVTQGEITNPEKALFTVADLSSLWVVIDIYEKDMASLRIGTSVSVSVTAFPDKVFRGRLSYISDVIDEKTRTEKASVTIDNSSGLLKPGMFATVTIDARSGQTEKLIAVPDDAVQIERTTRYVFVQTGPGTFRKRDITTGRALGKKTEITGGLREGEVIAVKGAYILKSELKKDELKGD